MSSGNHIRAVGPDAERSAQTSSDDPSEDLSSQPFATDELTLTEDDLEYPDEEATPERSWLMPALAAAAILAWTVLYSWSIQTELAAASGASPSDWTRWIIDWSVPVLLVCVAYLLALRNSRAEARRFGRTAQMLSRESRELEHRLSIVNRELSLAREFLATQSRELDSLGRIASDRIGEHAETLQGLIRDNGAQVDKIGSASETALANMKRLRDDLPVIGTSARDVSNQIGNAGRTAHEQLEALASDFERLEESSRASETQVSALGERVTDTLAGFETNLAQIEEVLGTRYDTLRDKLGTYRSEVDEAERQAVAGLSERLDALKAESKAIAAELRRAETDAMGQLEASKNRFYEDVSKTVESLDTLDREASDASKRRMDELQAEAVRFNETLYERDQRFIAEMAKRQDAFDAREAQASEGLAQRLADLDNAIAERREAQIADTERLVAHSTAMTAQIETLRTLIGEVAQQGDATREGLSEGLDALGHTLADRRGELDQTKEQLAELTDSGIRLLEIIQSGARHSREDLSQAIEGAGESLGSVEQRAERVSGVMFKTRGQADGLGEYLIETERQIEATDGSLQNLKTRLAEQSDEALARLNGLRGGFSQLAEESEAFTSHAQEQMRAALTALEDAIRAAFDTLDEDAREKVEILATSLSKDVVADIERTLRDESAASIERLETAAAQASGTGKEATALLRDQLTKVSELTLNLERRIARAQEKAQEQVGNDFSRRMALITDNLNSNAIDIAAALSTEVTDTAWAAYLKGDRGIFTRRAVRLVDKGEARAIAELYQRDDAFNAAVNRYIHDFEAMLRSMLSTRDGNALAVTILGSDIGKLYVVLAQALERFRT